MFKKEFTLDFKNELATFYNILLNKSENNSSSTGKLSLYLEDQFEDLINNYYIEKQSKPNKTNQTENSFKRIDIIENIPKKILGQKQAMENHKRIKSKITNHSSNKEENLLHKKKVDKIEFKQNAAQEYILHDKNQEKSFSQSNIFDNKNNLLKNLNNNLNRKILNSTEQYDPIKAVNLLKNYSSKKRETCIFESKNNFKTGNLFDINTNLLKKAAAIFSDSEDEYLPKDKNSNSFVKKQNELKNEPVFNLFQNLTSNNVCLLKTGQSKLVNINKEFKQTVSPFYNVNPKLLEKARNLLFDSKPNKVSNLRKIYKTPVKNKFEERNPVIFKSINCIRSVHKNRIKINRQILRDFSEKNLHNYENNKIVKKYCSESIDKKIVKNRHGQKPGIYFKGIKNFELNTENLPKEFVDFKEFISNNNLLKNLECIKMNQIVYQEAYIDSTSEYKTNKQRELLANLLVRNECFLNSYSKLPISKSKECILQESYKKNHLIKNKIKNPKDLIPNNNAKNSKIFLSSNKIKDEVDEFSFLQSSKQIIYPTSINKSNQNSVSFETKHKKSNPDLILSSNKKIKLNSIKNNHVFNILLTSKIRTIKTLTPKSRIFTVDQFIFQKLNYHPKLSQNSICYLQKILFLYKFDKENCSCTWIAHHFKRIWFKFKIQKLLETKLKTKNLVHILVDQFVYRAYFEFSLFRFSAVHKFLNGLLPLNVVFCLKVSSLVINENMIELELSDGWYSLFLKIQKNFVSKQIRCHQQLLNLINNGKIYIGKILRCTHIKFMNFTNDKNSKIDIFGKNYVKIDDNCLFPAPKNAKLGVRRVIFRPLRISNLFGDGMVPLIDCVLIQKSALFITGQNSSKEFINLQVKNEFHINKLWDKKIISEKDTKNGFSFRILLVDTFNCLNNLLGKNQDINHILTIKDYNLETNYLEVDNYLKHQSEKLFNNLIEITFQNISFNFYEEIELFGRYQFYFLNLFKISSGKYFLQSSLEISKKTSLYFLPKESKIEKIKLLTEISEQIMKASRVFIYDFDKTYSNLNDFSHLSKKNLQLFISFPVELIKIQNKQLFCYFCGNLFMLINFPNKFNFDIDGLKNGSNLFLENLQIKSVKTIGTDPNFGKLFEMDFIEYSGIFPFNFENGKKNNVKREFFKQDWEKLQTKRKEIKNLDFLKEILQLI